MSKLADALRSIQVFNNYELLSRFGEPGCVAIEYRATVPRSCEARRTRVWSPFRTDGLTDGRQSSSVYEKDFIGGKDRTYWMARNWAMERYGHDYVPSPFGGLIPKHVHHKAKQAALTSAQ